MFTHIMVHFVGVYDTKMFRSPVWLMKYNPTKWATLQNAAGGVYHTVWNVRAAAFWCELQYRLILSRYDA
jgi:hypothetical protein